MSNLSWKFSFLIWNPNFKSFKLESQIHCLGKFSAKRRVFRIFIAKIILFFYRALFFVFLLDCQGEFTLIFCKFSEILFASKSGLSFGKEENRYITIEISEINSPPKNFKKMCKDILRFKNEKYLLNYAISDRLLKF